MIARSARRVAVENGLGEDSLEVRDLTRDLVRPDRWTRPLLVKKRR